MEARSRDRSASNARKANSVSICLSPLTTTPTASSTVSSSSASSSTQNALVGCLSPTSLSSTTIATSSSSGNKKMAVESTDRQRNTDLLLQQLITKQSRLQCVDKIDTQLSQALDSVRCKDKKRKGQKLTTGMCKDIDKIDLNSSDSLVTQLNLKNFLNMQTFQSLPLYYQYKLAKLLPDCDQLTLPNGWVTIAPNAMSNEFFNRAQQLWISRLKESKLLPEYATKRKQEQDKERLKLDPWKLKHFEPVWGDLSSSSNKEDTATQHDVCQENIVEQMYRRKVPTAKRTGMKQSLAPSLQFKTQSGIVQLTSAVKSCKEVTSSKRRKIAANMEDKTVNATRVYLVSSVGKMQPVSQAPTSRSKIGNSSKKLDFETYSAGSNLSEAGFVAITSPTKNFNVQVVKNPQVSKYRINSNEPTSDRRSKKDSVLFCNCSQKAMKLCTSCKCFCHFDCVDLNGICNNCTST